MNNRRRAGPLLSAVMGMSTWIGCGFMDVGVDTTNFDFAPKVAEKVDLSLYGGLWYEVASIPSIASSFGLCTNTTAVYTLLDDGRVRLRNECRLFNPDGPPQSIEGVARAIDESNARLAILFDGFNREAEYNILDLDPDYQWALVGGGPDGLFILSRTPELDDETYEFIISQVSDFGYDPNRLERTFQSGE